MDNTGILATETGSIVLGTLGAFSNSGDVISASDLTLNTNQNLSNQGNLYANKNATFTILGDTFNSGLMGSEDDLFLNTKGDFYNTETGQLVSQSDLDVSTIGKLNNEGVIYAQKKVGIDSLDSIENAGLMRANNNEMTLNAARRLDNSGEISAQTNLTVHAGEGVNQTASGVLYAEQDLTVNSKKNLKTAGIIGTKKGEVRLNSEGTLDNTGKIIAGTNATLDVEGNVINAGITYAQKDIQLNTQGHFDNTGIIATEAGNITLAVLKAFSNNGNIVASNDLTLNANDSLSNQGSLATETGNILLGSLGAFSNSGDVISAGDLTLSSNENLSNQGNLYAQKKVEIDSGDDIQNSGLMRANDSEITLNAAHRLDNSGKIISGTNSTINAKGDFTNTGVTYAQDNIQLNTQGNFENTGIIATETGDITLAVLKAFSNSGDVISAHDLTLNANDSLSNQGVLATETGNIVLGTLGAFSNSGDVISAGDLMLNTNQNLLNQGNFYANKNATFMISGDVFNSGLMGSEGALSLNVQGDLENTETGRITAGQNTNLSVDGSVINAGEMSSKRDLLFNIKNIFTNSGVLYAGENIELHTGSDTQNSGLIYALKAAFLNSDANIYNSGDIGTETGSIYLNAQGEINNLEFSRMISGDDFHLNTKAEFKNSGMIYGLGETSIEASSIDNKGILFSHSSLLKSLGNIKNSGSIQTDQGVLMLDSGDEIENEGQIYSGSHLNLSAKNGLTQSVEGVMYASQDASLITSGDIINEGVIASFGNTHLQATGLNSQIQLGVNSLIGAGLTQNNQLLNQGDILLDATTNITALGQVYSGGDQTWNSQSLTLNGADVYGRSLSLNAVNGDLDARDANITAQKELNLVSSQTLMADRGNFMGQSLNLSAQSLQNVGGTFLQIDQLFKPSTLSVPTSTFNVVLTGELNNTGGTFYATGAHNIQADSVNNQDGLILSEDAISFILNKDFNNQDGQLYSNDALSITAQTLNNQNGILSSQGDMALVIDQALDNRLGNISSQGKLQLTANTLNNSQGVVASHDDSSIQIANDVINTHGILYSENNLNFEANSLQNQAGQVIAEQDATFMISNALTNTQGNLFAGNTLNLDANSLTGDGLIQSRGDLDIHLKSDYVHEQLMQSNGNLNFTTTGNFTNQGSLLSGKTLTLNVANLDNQKDGEIAAQTTYIHTQDTLTNRGLIDGGTTHLVSKSLDNVGTGRIYGDHLAISSSSFNNEKENNLAPVIAARNRLDLGVDTLTNSEHALIFSGGDMAIGGALDNELHAIGTADAINNHSATIEALGNLQLNTKNLNNTNEHLSTQVQLKSQNRMREYQATGEYGSPTRYTPLQASVNNGAIDGLKQLVVRDGTYWNPHDDCNCSDTFHVYDFTRTIYETQIVESDPGKILSGQNMRITADTVTNDNSHIIAGKTLVGEIGNFINTEVKGTRTTTDRGTVDRYWRDKVSGPDHQGHKTEDYAPATKRETIKLSAGVYQGNTQAGGSAYSVNPIQSVSSVSMPSIVIPEHAGEIDPNQGTPKPVGDLNVNTDPQDIRLEPIQNGSSNGQEIYAPGITRETIELNGGAYQGSDYSVPSVVMPEHTQDTSKPVGDLNVNPQDIRLELSQNGSSNGQEIYAPGLTREIIELSSGIYQGTAKPVSDNPQDIHPEPVNEVDLNTNPVEIRTIDPNVKLPDNSLYHIVSAPNSSGYLIETDPRFANYRNWLSSEYLLDQLGIDPAHDHQRLGDGFYEQRLVNEQISQLTGNTLLEGYENYEEQFQALMQNAIEVHEALELVPGVALTTEQMAQLTTDIVWLVEKEVTLEDGTTTKVLVPQVYVRVRPGDLTADGALFSGNEVYLSLDQDLTNQGTLLGKEVLSISADNIHNLTGTIESNNTQLIARNDLENLGGNLTGHDSLTLIAGKDLTIGSTLSTQQSSQGSRTNLSSVGSVNVTNEGGTLTMLAGNDINLTAANITNSGVDGTTQILAGNDLKLNTLTTQENQKFVFDKNNTHFDANSQEIGTSIHTTGDITLGAQNNLTIKAGNLISDEGAIVALAGNNLTIKHGTNTQSSEQHSQVTGGNGMFSSTTTTTHYEYQGTNAQQSNLSGDSIHLQAGKNLNIQGSNVVATKDVNLIAGEKLSITSAQNTQNSQTETDEEQSGLFGGSDNFNYSYGTQKQSTQTETNNVTQVGSIVGSLDGDIIIQAGDAYTQIASDLIALTGDIVVVADNINIQNGMNTSTTTQSSQFTQTGLSLGVTAPLISGAQTGQQMYDASGQTDNVRLQALAAGTTALAAVNTYDEIKGDPLTLGGVNVSLNFGVTKSESNSTQSTSTAVGSQLLGNNIALVATGDADNPSRESGNITIKGSNVDATNDLTLIAKNDITLKAAQNTSSQDSQSKTTSASIGIGANLNSQGVGLTGNFNASSGNSQSNQDTTNWTNTTLNAGNTVHLISGKDTTIQGATVSGDQVIANIAGNLLIESLQDTDTYTSKDTNSSVGISAPIPGAGAGKVSVSANYGETNINSNYASVTEQSGIRAGDGGFQIHVGGDTTLIGAVISSTEQAILDNKNLLETGTLTIKDITNYAEYDAQSTQFGVGYGKDTGIDQQGHAQAGSAQTPGTTLPTISGMSATLPVAMSAEDSASSITKSGISAGTIIITDKDKQQQLTGQTVEQTIANLNRDVETGKDTTNALAPIFDKDEIEAGFEIVQGLTREVGTFLENRAKETTEAQEALEEELKKPKDQQDPQKIAEYREIIADNETWEMGGTGRQVLTAVTLAASGNVTGSGAEFIQAATINYLQSLTVEEVKHIVDSLEVSEGEREVVRAALQGLTGCAGAAAQGSDCGTAAMGAASSVVINNVLDDITGVNAEDLTPEEKEARMNLVSGIIAGITQQAGGDAAVANAAAQMEIQNNMMLEKMRQEQNPAPKPLLIEIMEAAEEGVEIGKNLVEDVASGIGYLWDKLFDESSETPVAVDDNASISNDDASIDGSPDNKDESPGNTSLVDDKARKHILDGDGKNGGGHRAGTGIPGKNEFPPDWSDEKVIDSIEDIATDPSSTLGPGRWKGDVVAAGTRDGIDIEVVIDRNGRIVTAYPTNTPRNPLRSN